MSSITKKKYYGENTNTTPAETTIETICGNNEDRVFELEKQLHEQYAVNNNSNAGTLISILSALLVSITGFGYVLYQYQIMACELAIVNLSTIVAMAVMTLLYCISVHLGAGQRMEQFITIAIRKKHYNSKERYEEIFPNGYHPFNKNVFEFVQGIYNIWSTATFMAIGGIVACYLILIKEEYPCLIVACGVLSLVFCTLFRICKFRKYKTREHALIERYKNFLQDIDDDRKTFNWCGLICKILAFLFATIYIGLVVIACCRDGNKEIRQEQKLRISIENSEPVKVQIINQ